LVWAISDAKARELICRRVLVPRSDPSTDEFLSSVATIERSILLQLGDHAEADHQPSRETAFSITHVYTPVHLRRRGYATRMMTLLHAELSPLGILSFLYSGVGDFYSRCGSPGWHIHHSSETYWDVQEILHDTHEDDIPPSPIEESDFKEVASADAKQLEVEITMRSKNGEPPAFAILPTGDEYTWLVARSKFYGRILSYNPLPRYWGVRIPGPADFGESFAIWFFAYDKKELHFLRLRCTDVAAFRRIIYAASLAAEEQGCKRMMAWNVDDGLLAASDQGGRVTRPRTGNLAALAWYGEGGSPEWLVSEKYGWC